MTSSTYEEYTLLSEFGFFAIVDPFAYPAFVNRDLSFDALIQHIINQTRDFQILTWQTESEDEWRVRVVQTDTDIRGFQEQIGYVRVTEDCLCLSTLDSLYNAAEDYKVTIPYQDDVLIKMERGLYRCRVVKMYDPALYLEGEWEGDFEFLVQITKAPEDVPQEWEGIAWLQD